MLYKKSGVTRTLQFYQLNSKLPLPWWKQGNYPVISIYAPGQISYVQYIIFKVCQHINTLYLLGLRYDQKNYMFEFCYSYSTYHYNITTCCCRWWVITYKRHPPPFIQIFFVACSHFCLQRFFMTQNHFCFYLLLNYSFSHEKRFSRNYMHKV